MSNIMFINMQVIVAKYNKKCLEGRDLIEMFRCHGTFGISLNRDVFIRGPKVAVGNAQLVNLSLGAFKKGFDKGTSRRGFPWLLS